MRPSRCPECQKGKESTQSASPANANAAPAVEALKSVKVNMGPLGDFQINVYADGFFIASEKDNIQLEISNVGRALVLLRENLQDTQVQVVMANVDTHTVTSCRVQVLQSAANKEHTEGAASHSRQAVTSIFDRYCPLELISYMFSS